MLTYKKLLFDYYLALRGGEVQGNLISSDIKIRFICLKKNLTKNYMCLK